MSFTMNAYKKNGKQLGLGWIFENGRLNKKPTRMAFYMYTKYIITYC